LAPDLFALPGLTIASGSASNHSLAICIALLFVLAEIGLPPPEKKESIFQLPKMIGTFL